LNITFSEARYVKDLAPDSQSIKDINDGFAERATGIELASFFESEGVSLGPVTLLNFNPY